MENFPKNSKGHYRHKRRHGISSTTTTLTRRSDENDDLEKLDEINFGETGQVSNLR